MNRRRAMTAPVEVMLVDDHTLFRKRLAEWLEGRNAIQAVAVEHGVAAWTGNAQNPT